MAKLTALLGVLALLALGACGGDSAEDKYKDDFPSINRQLLSLGKEVGNGIQSAEGSSDEELADQFGNYAKQLGDIQQDLDELEPPDDLSEDQDQLVSAIGDTQGALDDIAAAAEQGDPQAARDATVRLISSSRELRDARRTLAEAVRDL